MRYFIDGKKIRISLFTNCIGKCCQFKVYKIDDNVVKITKSNPSKKLFYQKN